MKYAEAMKDLLRPLRVYELEESINGGELEAIGAMLDRCGEALEAVQREMLVSTATDGGLERVERLLARRPVTDDPERRRAALAALLRIGGDSFTLAAINDNLAGCGLNARACETETPGKVTVHFPEVPGVPEGFAEMRAIIEDILPCHLEIEYVFWYVTWDMIEGRFETWGDLERLGLTWRGLEKLVQ